jgi:hypothetical protein
MTSEKSGRPDSNRRRPAWEGGSRPKKHPLYTLRIGRVTVRRNMRNHAVTMFLLRVGPSRPTA